MKDEDFGIKTINEGNVDIQKFPTSKVRQLAKKMESSKATAKHIRQVSVDLPATQIHLMCHQHTELLTRNYNKQKTATKQKPQKHRPTKQQMSKKPFDLRNTKSSLIDASDVATQYMQKDSNVLQKIFSAKCVTNLDTSLQSLTRRINRHQACLSLGNIRHTNYEQGPYTLIKMVIAMYLKNQILMNHSVYR